MSPLAEQQQEAAIFNIAPNPFPQGRVSETARRRASRMQHTRGLIWC